MNSDEALQMLKDGNKRFASDQLIPDRKFKERREQTAREGQKPFAAILACADSRVPVELVFDQGLGDIFVSAVAGNICAETVAATFELGVREFGIPLIVVLGHSNCGAVSLAVKEDKIEDSLMPLVKRIRPAVMAARMAGMERSDPDFINSVAKINVKEAIDDLFDQSPYLKEMAQNGDVAIVPAFYDILSGEVEWIE
ncbi:carbonic anhydrase [bacterium]|nr:carbonic anhydrase [bacterium]